LPKTNPSSFCFEPMRFVVSSSESRRVTSRTSRIRYRRFVDEAIHLPEPGTYYFFQKAIAENTEEFESINVSRELGKLVSKGANSIIERLKAKFESVFPSPEIIESLVPSQKLPDHYYLPRIARELPTGIYFHKKKPVVLIPISPVSIYLFGCERKHVRDVISEIVRKCEELNEVTSDFGLELVKVLTSREYQEYLLKNLEHIEKIEVEEPKNDFENAVIQVCEKITTSFLPNVNIKFNEPTENFEYDLFLGFGDKSRVIIEPTDYEILKTEIENGKFGKDTMKSRIILGTLDKARRLQAESIVVVKGFPKEKLSALKSLADSRGVTLMSEETYRDNLPSVLLNTLKGILIPQ
jgi:hypothetical protein